MNYGWNERPTKATVKHLIGGDEPATVYEIGKYQVTVAGPEVAVTYSCPRYGRDTDPRRAFPNMDVTDGEIRIPVADLVDEVLSRLDPVELARELWANKEVKAEFIECLIEQYNDRGLDDSDRRKLLAGVKETVHNTSIGALAATMAKIEFEIARNANHYREIDRMNETLSNMGVCINRTVYVDGKPSGTESVPLQFQSQIVNHGDLSIGGKAWNEARDFWRQEVLRQFPLPEAPVTTNTED